MAKTTQTHGKYKGVLVSKTDTRKLYQSLKIKRKELIAHLVEQFSYIGEACVKMARESGDYEDITGNPVSYTPLTLPTILPV